MDSTIVRSLILLASLTPAYTLAKPAESDQDRFDTFVTRPDIKAPRWNVTIYDPDRVTPGYWFVGPYESMTMTEPGGPWIGPHIYDTNGELIWSGGQMFDNLNIHDFRVSNVNGKDMLQAIHYDEGFGYILGHDYKIADKIYMGERDVSMNMHELNFVDNGTRALILNKNFTNATREMSKEVNHDGECFAKFDGFADLSVDDWKPQFEWSAYGHIGLNESTMQAVGNKCKSKWDYLHSNAVDKCPDGDYIISMRHSDAIYKVSHTDGSIVWRLGGTKSDFAMGAVNFSRQHDVRCRGQNATHTFISMLDNAKGEDNRTPTFNHSRGILISLATHATPMTAHLEAAYHHPDGDGAYTWRRGNFQIMQPSGHALVCWSEQSHFSEHAADGTLLMEARMLARILGTYRGYKFPWVGMPTDPPDVHAAGRNSYDDERGTTSTATLVHVSWNGATEVAAWRVLKTTRDGRHDIEAVIAEEPRAGFETTLTYAGFAGYVVVEALDKDGHVLGRSKVTRTTMPEDILTVDVANEVLWLQKMAALKDGVELPDGSKTAADLGLLETAGKEQLQQQEEAEEDEEEEMTGYEGSVIDFVLGFFSAAGLFAVVWFFRYGRKSWRWRRHYQSLTGKEHEPDEERPEKGGLLYSEAYIG